MTQWHTTQYHANLVDMHIVDWHPDFLSQYDSETYENLLARAGVKAA